MRLTPTNLMQMTSRNKEKHTMEWTNGWRERYWGEIDQNWDVIIIGGGITGAGILRQCVHAGLKAILFEAEDFASGTSSRSSKLVHGGMRYLKNAQVRVTLESVREREYLLKQGRGLVIAWLLPVSDSDALPAGSSNGLGHL
jgi:glycerol-3-phosphate dehydrogenase